MKKHLIYTRSDADWQRFLNRHPQWQAHASHYPLLGIEPSTLDCSNLDTLQNADVLVFTSHHAVSTLLDQYHPDASQKLIAIGKRTAATLRSHIKSDSIITAPPPFNSEALLASWQPQRQKIAIIAAPHGRTLLADTLSSKNNVSMIYTYRRYCIHHTDPFPYQQDAHNILLISSGNGLQCLLEFTPQKMLKLLQYKITVACISPRLAALSRQAGFQLVINAAQAEEDALLSEIAACQPPFTGTLEYSNEQ